MLWIKFGVMKLKREQEYCETLYGLWIERNYESFIVKLVGIDFE